MEWVRNHPSPENTAEVLKASCHQTLENVDGLIEAIIECNIIKTLLSYSVFHWQELSGGEVLYSIARLFMHRPGQLDYW